LDFGLCAYLGVMLVGLLHFLKGLVKLAIGKSTFVGGWQKYPHGTFTAP
jgi:hypothetical protein